MSVNHLQLQGNASENGRILFFASIFRSASISESQIISPSREITLTALLMLAVQAGLVTYTKQ